MKGELREDLAHVLNIHSIDTVTNTPDFILAEYLVNALGSFGSAVNNRDVWHGEE